MGVYDYWREKLFGTEAEYYEDPETGTRWGNVTDGEGVTRTYLEDKKHKEEQARLRADAEVITNSIVPERVDVSQTNARYGDFTNYSWGSNADLMKLLEGAGQNWNIDPSAFKLNGKAEYASGFRGVNGSEDMFPNAQKRASVTFGGAATNRFDGSGNQPTMHARNYSDLEGSSFNHEIPHMVTGHLRSLLADGTHRPWNASTDKGLTGYGIFGDNLYEQDYSNLRYSVMPNQDLRENDVHQRADRMYQRFMNDSGNQQRPELKEAIGKGMGYILSDDLLYGSSGYSIDNAQSAQEAYNYNMKNNKIPSDMSFEDFSTNYEATIAGKRKYARSPEEVFARAIASYNNLRQLSDEDRQSYFNDPASIKGFMFNDSNDVGEDGKKKFGDYNIRNETYQAIENMMSNMRLNKTKDGFAQLELDNYLGEKLYYA
jgi:hypothetical protein